MRRRGGSAAAVLLAVGMLGTGCTSQAPVVGVQHALYQYSCCQDSDLATVQRPGESITLHWIVTAAPPTGSATAVPVTLSAVLTGPFPDVSALKTAMASGSPPAAMVAAADVRTTDRAGGAPISTLRLPAAATAGFYDVRTTVASGGGTLSADGIIQVGPVAPGAAEAPVTGYYTALAAHDATTARQYLAPEYFSGFATVAAFKAWVDNYLSLTNLRVGAAQSPTPDIAAQHPGYQDLFEYPVSYIATLRQILGNEGPGGTDRFVLVGRTTDSSWLILDIASSP